ncbi:MAG TPA: hypothetical protein VF870_07615 [Ignavibacteriaceae bacterium]
MIEENVYISNNYEKMKCIWMASQVVEYKLCDNQFDCENCRFDKVMRNLLNEKETQNTDISNIANTISNKLRSIKFDDKIIYLKNNLIAKEICHDTFYLGINPILICFLDSVSSLSVSECRKNILTDQQVIQILGEWGSVSLSAPMNFVIYDLLDFPIETLLEFQWVAIIGAVNPEVLKGRFVQDEWQSMHEKALNAIEDIKSRIPQVGNTMMDGGTQIKFLHQLVGKKRYINILNSIAI